jgi:hypothetical protein
MCQGPTLNVVGIPPIELSIAAIDTSTTTPFGQCGSGCSFRVGQISGGAFPPDDGGVASATLTMNDVTTDAYTFAAPPTSQTWNLALVPPDWGNNAWFPIGTLTSAGTLYAPHAGSSWTSLACWGALSAPGATNVQGYISEATAAGTSIASSAMFAAPVFTSPVGGSVSWPTDILWTRVSGSPGAFELNVVGKSGSTTAYTHRSVD